MIRDPQGKLLEAIEHINRYEYRKAFGLTSQEYEEEPLDELLINQHIMSLKAELEQEKMKEAERRSKG